MARVSFYGYETGDFGELTSVGAGFSVDSTTKRSGAYSMRKDTTTTGGDVYIDLTSSGALSRVRTRYYLRFTNPAGIGVSNYLSVILLDLYNTSVAHNAQITWGVGGSSSYSNIAIFDAAFGTVVNAGISFPNDAQWYRVECDVNISTGNASVYIDGTLVASCTGASLGSGSAEFIKIGPQTGVAPGAGFDYYLDDIAVDDAALPGAGQIIARQFKAGTPTNTSWTKNGGTNIQDVWNDTPFSTSTSASTQAGAEQSALISSFSATQTGHGTETVASIDTLNTVKVAAVAKTSNAGTGTGITQVGNILATSSLNGVDVTLTFSTAPSTGDVVFVWGGHTSTRATPIGPSTSGYTQLGTTQNANSNVFGVWYKIMGATPDTNVVCQGTGNTADSTGYGCIVLRSVAPVITDVAIAFATGSSTNPNPPSITTVSNGDFTIICAGTVASDSAWTSPSNYGTTVANGSNDTNPYSVGGALRSSALGPGVTEDPANWTNVATGGWHAATIAVKTAVHSGAIAGIGTIALGYGADLSLTTSDAYYERYFTPGTLSSLNADEFTALHGNTLQLQTIEDAWVMVEYTPTTKQSSIAITQGAVMRAALW